MSAAALLAGCGQVPREPDADAPERTAIVPGGGETVQSSETPQRRDEMPEIEIGGIVYREQVEWDTPRQGFAEPGGVFDEELERQEEGFDEPVVTVTVAPEGTTADVRYLEENIPDDAIGARELRAIMERRPDGLWYVRRLGWRQRCWRGPTPDSWISGLCP